MNNNMKIVVSRQTELSLEQLPEELRMDDIEKMSHVEAMTTAKVLLRLLKHPKHDVEVDDAVVAKPKARGNDNLGNFGLKKGTTSKYHYVSRINQNRYQMVLDGTSYQTEKLAAKAADSWIANNPVDAAKKERPLNRDKFPEILED